MSCMSCMAIPMLELWIHINLETQIIYFFMSPLNPNTMIFMSPAALGMGHITDVFIH